MKLNLNLTMKISKSRLLHNFLVIDGSIKSGDHITSKITGKSYEIKDVGLLRPNEVGVPSLYVTNLNCFKRIQS